MRAQPFRVLLAAGCILAPAAPVLAQSSMAWTDRVRVSVNFGLQPSSASFDASATKTTHLEDAVFRTTSTVGSGPMFDGGVAVRVKKGFGVGVALSSFGQKKDAAVSGSIPHPFFYNATRAITGTAGLERKEIAAHIQAVYVLVGRKFDLALGAGPSWFRVNQDLVTDVAYTEDYPYDAATFASATASRVTKSQFGFNVGADVGWRLSRNVGVGGIVRFSRASVTLAGANGVSVTVDAGGLQVGGGLRVYY